MYFSKVIVNAACVISTLAGVISAESLEKRHQLEFRLGAWNQTTDSRAEIRPGSVTTSVDAGGFGASLSYGHWLAEGWALRISVGGLAADVETRVGTSGVYSETAIVSHFLFGGKYYFLRSTYGSSVRPYASVDAGPYIGSQSKTEAGAIVAVESRTETALGGQLGAGIDFIAGRHFMTGFSVGYNLMTDFDQSIGGSRNYSGPIFSIGLSFLFGKGTK